MGKTEPSKEEMGENRAMNAVLKARSPEFVPRSRERMTPG